MTTLLGDRKLDVLEKALIETKNIKGAVFECGVYKGGSALHIAKKIKEHNITKDFHIFDSFCGMPLTTKYDNHHKEGNFNDTSLQLVENLLNNYDVSIHKGFIPHTFSEVNNITKISFVHLDLDLYEGYKSTLEFVWPKMDKGSIIIMDDYGCNDCLGAKKAADDFFIDKIEKPQKTWLSQYKVVKE